MKITRLLVVVVLGVSLGACTTVPLKTYQDDIKRINEELATRPDEDAVDAKFKLWGDKMAEEGKHALKGCKASLEAFRDDCGCLNDQK